jgi:hypothetical protein
MKRTEKRRHIEPSDSDNEREYQFQVALAQTQGIHTHFWLESSYVDLYGQVQRLTEYKKNSFLKKLVKITNLGEKSIEWPGIKWEDVVFKHITTRQLTSNLIRLCAPPSFQLEAILNEIEIPVEPVVAPYVKQEWAPWPTFEQGATILDNVRLRVSAETREVGWASRVLFTSQETGIAQPLCVTGRTLRRLIVTIEQRLQSRLTHQVWVQIHRDRERAESSQNELLKAILN